MMIFMMLIMMMFMMMMILMMMKMMMLVQMMQQQSAQHVEAMAAMERRSQEQMAAMQHQMMQTQQGCCPGSTTQRWHTCPFAGISITSTLLSPAGPRLRWRHSGAKSDRKFRDGFRTSEDYASFQSELAVQQATNAREPRRNSGN